MRAGVIEIIFNSYGSSHAENSYIVFFVPDQRASIPIRMRQLSGLEALKEFLLGLDIPEAKMNAALASVPRLRVASIPNVTLSNDQLEKFNLSWGEQGKPREN